MNFSRLRLGIGFALIFVFASGTAGLAQFGSNPQAPLLPATPAPNVTAAPTPNPAAPTAAAPNPAAPTVAPNPAAPTVAPNPGAPTEVPSPVATPTPAATPSGRPRRGRRAPAPKASGSPNPSESGTPEPPQFTTLDGIWEVELQPLGKRLAVYTHFSITATGANITGYWEHGPKKVRTPMTGTFDGRLISLSVPLPDGTTSTFSGYVETFADMVGLMRTSDKDSGTAFTAEHRKKLKS